MHREYKWSLPQDALKALNEAEGVIPTDFDWNIAKVSPDRTSVTFSRYPDFDSNPHPELEESIKVDLNTKSSVRRRESKDNPSILHRKETFVDPSHPLYSKFSNLSHQEEEAGLLPPIMCLFIGRKRQWEQILNDRHLRIIDHNLTSINHSEITMSQLELFPLDRPRLSIGKSQEMSGKTAMSRIRPSLVARILVEKNLLNGRVFDWGCGRGADLRYFRECGFQVEGWDPVHMADRPPSSYPADSFDWVHCAYVLNTLPTQEERLSVLWSINEFLPPKGIVSVAVRSRSEIERLRKGTWKRFSDGWLTSRGTFQKGFEPEQLMKMVEYCQFEPTLLLSDPVFVIGRKL